ncbi:unnamed protein product, partial [Urochloa humidicola]
FFHRYPHLTLWFPFLPCCAGVAASHLLPSLSSLPPPTTDPALLEDRGRHGGAEHEVRPWEAARVAGAWGRRGYTRGRHKAMRGERQQAVCRKQAGRRPGLGSKQVAGRVQEAGQMETPRNVQAKCDSFAAKMFNEICPMKDFEYQSYWIGKKFYERMHCSLS